MLLLQNISHLLKLSVYIWNYRASSENTPVFKTLYSLNILSNEVFLTTLILILLHFGVLVKHLTCILILSKQ